LHERPDSARHHIPRRPSVDDNAARRFLRRKSTIGLSKSFVKLLRLRLEAVGGFLTAPAIGAREPYMCRHIKNERELGNRRPNGYAFEASDEALVDIAESALIDAR